MIELKNEDEYYEHINYRDLLKLQPDDFYLHLPTQIPFTKWFFEAQLQMLLMFGMRPNYFGLRHGLDPLRVSVLVSPIERAQSSNHEIRHPLEVTSRRRANDDRIVDQ